MANEQKNAEQIEKLTNAAQLLSYLSLPPVIKGTIGILTGHAGIAGNLADLIEKTHNGKVKSSDIVDFVGSASTIVGVVATIKGAEIVKNRMIVLSLFCITYNYLENNNWDVKKALNNANDDFQNSFDELQESVWDAIDYYNAVNYDDFKKDLNYSIDKMLEYFKSKSNKHSQISQLQTNDQNDKFTNLQIFSLQQTPQNNNFINSQNIRHSEPLTRHSERSEESQKNLQNICHSKRCEESQINSQNTCHSERSEESKKNLQNVNSQTSQNTPKGELTFTEKLLLKDFAYKLYGVKMPETKQRIGADAATQCKISLFLGDISKHKRQIVQNFGEKTWQETFENFQKTNDLKVFENALKSPLSQQNANLQIPNENANLKNTNLQNSAGNVNSENNITNPQENGNDFKM